MMSRKRIYGGGNFVRRPYKKYRKGVNLQQKVTRLQRQVALLKPEIKEFQDTVSVSNVTQAAGSIIYLSQIVQGTTDSSRVGDSIRTKTLRFHGLLNPFGSVTHCRMYIVKDMMSNGAFPVIAGTNQSVLSSFVPRLAFQNSLTTKRFKILWEYSMTDAMSLNGVNGAPAFDTGRIPIPYISTFIANNGTEADAQRNQYYFILIVDGADTLDYNAAVEITFSDV